MFRILWLRKMIRRHSSPIPEESAAIWKRRLSLIYVFFAWNAGAVILYNITKGRTSWGDPHGSKEQGSSAQQWSRILGIKNATVYKISGANVSKYELNNEYDPITNELVKSVEINKNEVQNIDTETLTE